MIVARVSTIQEDYLFFNLYYYDIMLKKYERGLHMNTEIDFFNGNISAAIGAGIYGVYFINAGNEELLYVGESVFVLIRCATHLFNFKKNPEYFGFKKEYTQRSDIKLSFRLIKQVDDMKERKKLEKELIKTLNPKLQSGISDRMKNIDDKIVEITNLLNQ